MSKNSKLHRAKKIKNDEFYTLYSDIDKEVSLYKDQLSGKVIYCNADTGESNFVKFFLDHFEEYNIRELYATGIDSKTGMGNYIHYDGEKLLDLSIENGSFEANIDILEKSDIIITNPPFSLFRKFVDVLMQHNKKFLIIGNKNVITYKDIFPYIKSNKLWLGVTKPSDFIAPTEITKKIKGLVYWFTNLPNDKRNKKLILTKEYNPEEYPKYDNHDAIHIDKVKNIPKDYYGAMGVPISFLDKYNPDQFEIIGFRKGIDGKDLTYTVNNKQIYPYTRIIIQRKRVKND